MNSNLLASQANYLEIPKYGILINIFKTPEKIIEDILIHLKLKQKPFFLGIIGLDVMGKSLSLNIAEKGYAFSVYNRATIGEENIIQAQRDYFGAHTHQRMDVPEEQSFMLIGINYDRFYIVNSSLIGYNNINYTLI